MYAKRNIQEPSRNHFSCTKATSITYLYVYSGA
jgi:hypothetical protein